MSDELEEIKERSKNQYVIHTDMEDVVNAGGVRSELDVKRLISELDHCHVVVKRIKAEKTHLKKLLSECDAENKWLINNIAELKEFNSECEDRYKLMASDRDYAQSERLRQKKHRKYAIKEARELLREGRNIDKEADRYYTQAERFKRRVGELLTILGKHGISC